MFFLSSTASSSLKWWKRLLSPQGFLFHSCVKCLRPVMSGYITILIVLGKKWYEPTNPTRFMIWLFNFQHAKLSMLSIKWNWLTDTVECVMCHYYENGDFSDSCLQVWNSMQIFPPENTPAFLKNYIQDEKISAEPLFVILLSLIFEI